MLNGRHSQPLPRVPGRFRGALLAGATNDGETGDGDNEPLEAWLVPWRVGSNRELSISVCRDPDTVLVVDVSRWPEPHEGRKTDAKQRPRDKTLRRAARVLDLTPGAFSTQPSVDAAYERLEEIWDDSTHEDHDPLGELLVKQAKRLRRILEDLGSRPRAVLRTEHRMLKLQDVRRIDAKTLHWISAQPGRNTAERAGARQRIKAPKRYETIATLENRVLRAFAALTVREARNWLAGQKAEGVNDGKRKDVEAHQLRARRVEALLRERRVPEAVAPVEPNFPLRFDQRYREIWRAWQDLRARNRATELEWMWQHRTFMELLGLRAAMQLHQAVRKKADFGMLAHKPILRGSVAPAQGHYLMEQGIQCTFGKVSSGSVEPIGYESGEHACRLGAVAEVDSGSRVSRIWWDALVADPEDPDVVVGELPWSLGHAWDARLKKWAAQIAS